LNYGDNPDADAQCLAFPTSTGTMFDRRSTIGEFKAAVCNISYRSD